MKVSILPLIAALALAAAPSFVAPPIIRMFLLLPCFGAGLFLAFRWVCRQDPALPSINERLRSQDQVLLSLTDQLRDVLSKTERAVLDINERFMNIAGRARRQLSTAPTTVLDSPDPCGGTTPACSGGEEREAGENSPERKEMTDETALLTRDIHGVISALQFEDLVRQQIVHIIAELQQHREELAEMERQLAPPEQQG